MSSLTDEQVLKIQIVEYKRWPDESIHAAQALANILEIFTKQRATIEAQAQRIHMLDQDVKRLEMYISLHIAGQRTLHDEYTMAALTGIMVNAKRTGLDGWTVEDRVRYARQHADEAMRQRKEAT